MTQIIAVPDPRTFEGDPFEVVERTVKQAEALAAALTKALSDVNVMARNAEMERQLQGGDSADAAAWEDAPLARRIEVISEDAAGIVVRLQTVRRAASFNPKNPPKEVA